MADAVRAIVSSPAPGAPRTEHDWSTFLAAELRVPVGVVYTRSRKTPVAVRTLREPRGALEVRLHKLFADAPPEVPSALASWVRSGRRAPRACAHLDAYIAEILRRAPPSAARRALVPRGDHHDLDRMARELLSSELAAEFPASTGHPHIGWGRRAPSRTRRSLRLGSYDSDGHIVRIHPVLDQPAVPDWFVRYVVFHELLHAVFPVERGADDRWIHHGRAFRRRERAYADHRRALAWERAHLNALIRSARTGTPLAMPKETRREARAHEPQAAAPRTSGVLRVLQQLLFPDR
ncbi:MAG: hypothetical protein NTY35_14050 [Planctomycetota bacterium]|nr:hypothetical protein [Planctomycetota bacterium]